MNPVEKRSPRKAQHFGIGDLVTVRNTRETRGWHVDDRPGTVVGFGGFRAGVDSCPIICVQFDESAPDYELHKRHLTHRR